MVKPGTNVVWSRWISGAKETLSSQYRVQVENMERVLPEEQDPLEKLGLNAAVLSDKTNVEFYRQE